LSSLWRIGLASIQITANGDSENSEIVAALVADIEKNQMRIQAPLYVLIHDASDVKCANIVPRKKLELDSGYYLFQYNGKYMVAHINLLQSQNRYNSQIVASSVNMELRVHTARWNMDHLMAWFKQHNVVKQKSAKQQVRENILNAKFYKRRFTPSVEETKVKAKEDPIFLYVLQRQQWIKYSEIYRRDVDTVVLPTAVKTAIFSDYDRFCSDAMKKFYKLRFLHYKRSYLLHGRPGGGKTSFIRAFASKYNLDIYELDAGSFHNMNQLRLQLASIPEKSIIIFEDIDVAFPDRETVRKEIANDNTFTDKDGKTQVSKMTSQQSMMLLGNNGSKTKKQLLSQFLNILDGIVNSLEGCVLFFTTNYVDRLDTALRRPGRCDMAIEFPVLTRDCVEQMVRLYHPGNTVEAAAIGTFLQDKDVMPCTLNEYLKQHIQLSPVDLVAKCKGYDGFKLKQKKITSSKSADTDTAVVASSDDDTKESH
jgi:hypothetical protein